MVIGHNLAAFRALNCYLGFQKRSATIMERLSSGQRINRAADDPAGFAISRRMMAQLGGLQQAQRNVQDAISLVQTMEGGISEIISSLQRMRELSVRAATDTISDSDRGAIQTEIDQLREGIKDIANNTQFNGINLLNRGDGPGNGSPHSGNGAASNQLHFQVGADAGNTFRVDLTDVTPPALGIADLDVSTREKAGQAITLLDRVLDSAGAERSTLGAYRNSLERLGDNAAIAEINLTATVSRICDVDIAAEMMELAKVNLLMQISLVMMLKANQQAREVLKLLPQ